MLRKGLAAAAAVAIVVVGVTASTAAPPSALDFTPVASANTKAPGFAAPNMLSPELQEIVWAQGSYKLDGGTAAVPYYGYDGNGPMVPSAAAPTVEASKTEPDKNTYLVLPELKGADAGYRYGSRFLFQGHELGTPGYITRIKLDADGAHRVTLLATKDAEGNALKNIQALQVLVHGTPLTFNVGGGTADEAINAPGYLALHQYGSSYPTKWVTIAETTAASPAPGPDLNALAKAASATPFKRPENGVFRPGTHFGEFWFDETGDTNANTSAAASGGFTGVFKLVQHAPAADVGTISVFYNGDVAHAGFDNVAFFSAGKIAFVEDGGDTLHTQRNALDSGYLFDVRLDYSSPANKPVRFLAEGRDPSATIDSGLSGSPGFTNDGDNEITGIHVSDGDASIESVLGAKVPRPFQAGSGWRVVWTQQHGDNPT